MDLETALLEVKGLSKTIRIFHGVSVDDNQNTGSVEGSLPVKLWAKFFKLHVLIAAEKMHQEKHFRTWRLYVKDSLKNLGVNKDSEVSGETILKELLEVSRQAITQTAFYYIKVTESQLSYLKTNSVSFSQEYLNEAVDYYSFWHSKFEKIICRAEYTDLDVIALADSLKLFNENHEDLQNSIIHWPLPLGCHYPKFDNTLDMFLSTTPEPPSPQYSNPNEVENLGVTSIAIAQSEYDKAVGYLNAYAEQLEERCGTIFPTPDLLDRRFTHYREELRRSINTGLAPLRTYSDGFDTVIIRHDLSASELVDNSISAVNSCGRILVIAKRRVKEALSRFLVHYYGDVLKNFKRGKGTVRRLQKHNSNDLSFQLQLRNRILAYEVWKDALNTAIADVKRGKFTVLCNVYQVQFYFVDLLNEVTLSIRSS